MSKNQLKATALQHAYGAALALVFFGTAIGLGALFGHTDAPIAVLGQFVGAAIATSLTHGALTDRFPGLRARLHTNTTDTYADDDAEDTDEVDA